MIFWPCQLVFAFDSIEVELESRESFLEVVLGTFTRVNNLLNKHKHLERRNTAELLVHEMIDTANSFLQHRLDVKYIMSVDHLAVTAFNF